MSLQYFQKTVRCGPAVTKLTCMSSCTLAIVTLDAVEHFLLQVLQGFVPVTRVSSPIVIDQLSYFAFSKLQGWMEYVLLSRQLPYESLTPLL